MQHPDLHKKLLELSDAVGRLSQRILAGGVSNLDLCDDAPALNQEYAAQLDQIKKERLRRDNVAVRNGESASSLGSDVVAVL